MEYLIQVVGEGNTRTAAVFFIKYLRTLGFDMTNTHNDGDLKPLIEAGGKPCIFQVERKRAELISVRRGVAFADDPLLCGTKSSSVICFYSERQK